MSGYWDDDLPDECFTESERIAGVPSLVRNNDYCIQHEGYSEDDDDDIKEFRTWSQWQRIDRQVIKGSKAIKINGIPNFSFDQTMPLGEAYKNAAYSYDEWRSRGFQVIKGSKATLVNGKKVFFYHEVRKL